MTKPNWVSPDIGQAEVHVFSCEGFPARGKTPDGVEFSNYELNPTKDTLGQITPIGVDRLDDLCWY